MNAQLLQLLISLAGIALMIGLCAVLFSRHGSSLIDIGAVSENLARDIPGFRAGAATLSRDGRTALIEDARDAHTYLVVLRGEDLVTRKLPHDLRMVREGERLELTLDDFTLRRAELDLADAAAWEAKLKGLAA